MISVNRMLVNSLVLLFFVILTYVYVDFLQGSNAYIGYKEINFDVKYFLWLLVCLFVTLPLLPQRFELPSDIYIFLHLLLIVLPYSFLSLSGVSEISWNTVFFFILIIFPLYLVKILGRIKSPVVYMPRFLDRDYAFLVVSVVVVVLIFLAFRSAPLSSSLDYNSSYVRRLEGRISYPTGSLLAYSNSIVMNGLLPLLAFWAGLKRSKFLFLVPFMGWLSFYYLLGVKAPIFYIGLSFILGVIIWSRRYRSVVLMLLLFLLSLIIISVVELLLFEYSYLADYFFRRAFTVPVFLMSTYSSFIAVFYNVEWYFFVGSIHDTPVSFLIGEGFMGMKGLNANTNTYIYAFTSGGVFSYFFVCLVVAITFTIMDVRYKSSYSLEMIFCGFIFGILLIEQYVTTIFLSSGFFVVFLVSLLIKNER